MPTANQIQDELDSKLKHETPSPASTLRASKEYRAWIAKGPKEPMVLETFDPGPLGSEDIEVAVEHCGVCHSDLSILNNDWGTSRYPAILGHEVVGRVSAIGANAKRLAVGQRVGVGWFSGSCMHCKQCMSGSHHLCTRVQATVVGHSGGFATHVRSHWAWAIPLPQTLNFPEVGPLLCEGVTVFAPLAMYAKPTERVGIIGTLSFLFSAPGWEPSLSGFPALSASVGQFLIKDVGLLGAAIWTCGEAYSAKENNR